MIIIEGFDNTGKTTLARYLQDEFGFDYIHSPGPMDKGKQMMDWALREIAADRYAIYDRLSPITDPVYAPVIRKEESAYTSTIRGSSIVDLLMVSHHLVIYCRPPVSSIIGFEDGREQMDGVEENAKQLIVRYDKTMFDMYHSPYWKMITYDYTQGDMAMVAVKHQIKKYMKGRNKI